METSGSFHVVMNIFGNLKKIAGSVRYPEKTSTVMSTDTDCV